MTREPSSKRSTHPEIAVAPDPDMKKSSDSLITIKPDGIKFWLRWRGIIPALLLVLGGGTVAGFSTDALDVGGSADDLSEFRASQSEAHRKINAELDSQAKRATSQDRKIAEVSEIVADVRKTQQRDVARNEARRVTAEIQSRVERESEYDRIYELNLNRLQRGEDPCGTRTCE